MDVSRVIARDESRMHTVTPVRFDQGPRKLSINEKSCDIHAIWRNGLFRDCPVVVPRYTGIRIVSVVVSITRVLITPWEPVW